MSLWRHYDVKLSVSGWFWNLGSIAILNQHKIALLTVYDTPKFEKFHFSPSYDVTMTSLWGQIESQVKTLKGANLRPSIFIILKVHIIIINHKMDCVRIFQVDLSAARLIDRHMKLIFYKSVFFEKITFWDSWCSQIMYYFSVFFPYHVWQWHRVSRTIQHLSTVRDGIEINTSKFPF